MRGPWDAAGDVDGYVSRTWGVLLLPPMTAGLAVLLVAIPSMDPLQANIARFRAEYNAFVVGFVAFMVYTYALTLAAGTGRQFNMTQMLLPAMGLLFIGIGRVLRTARRNYFIGIRTPWTLTGDERWQATHVLGLHRRPDRGDRRRLPRRGWVLADDGCPDRSCPRPGRVLLRALAAIGPSGADTVMPAARGAGSAGSAVCLRWLLTGG